MKVIFSHGKESGPWGAKIKAMAAIAEDLSYTVESIDYSEIRDPDGRVERLLESLRYETQEFCLVGSSMGGYVSLVTSMKVPCKGVFLLAPALYMKGYKQQEYIKTTHVEIVHGWSDEVIPYQNSIRFAETTNSRCHLIEGNHRLSNSMEPIKALFSNFLITLNRI